MSSLSRLLLQRQPAERDPSDPYANAFAAGEEGARGGAPDGRRNTPEGWGDLPVVSAKPRRGSDELSDPGSDTDLAIPSLAELMFQLDAREEADLALVPVSSSEADPL